MSVSAVVKFPAYRLHEALRIDISNSLMGLLAGAQLSNHLLHLNRGSSRLLPEVYPNVPHIRRFNLTAEAASGILADADVHLGAMSIAYVLALHEDFMKTCLLMAADGGLTTRRRARDATAATQHRLLESSCGASFDAVTLEQLDVLRLMRNCVVHAGGRVGHALHTAITALTDAAVDRWDALAESGLRGLAEGELLRFGHGEMLVALALTKQVDREANQLLQAGLPRSIWADIVVDDALEQHPDSVRNGSANRKISGVARHHYGALAMSTDELRSACERRTAAEEKRGSSR